MYFHAGSDWYDDGLLDLAYDLGERLLPAFATPTGLPFHRVNLRHGVEKTESKETCTAAAGTLHIEFAMLSMLTGDMRFEIVARKAVKKIWSKRSSLDLVGSNLNIFSGQWTQSHASIGGGVDSFYEYLFKSWILFGKAIQRQNNY